jgi:hypothetical protein
MRSGAPLLVMLLAAASGLAQTRPLLTEEATTAAAGHLGFETGLDYISNARNYVSLVRGNRWDGPLLRLVYSPADSVELDLEWVVRVRAVREAGAPDVSDWGDVTLRTKLRFHDGRGRGPTFGGRFGVTLPETSFSEEGEPPLGLGPNTIRVFADALVTQPLGRFALHLNAGFATQDEVFRPHDQRDFATYGFALTWALRPAWQLVAEVAGRTGKGMPGVEEHSEARAGLRFGKGPVVGDAAVRHGFAAADGDWGATAGLTWTIRRSKPSS